MIFPLYPYELDNPSRGIKNQAYLSPEFLDHLKYAIDTAQELGFKIDLVMGTGWPYGGPMVPQKLSPRELKMISTPVSAAAGTNAAVKLPSMGPDDDLVAVLLAPQDASRAAGAPSADLSARVANHEVSFTVPPGNWEIMTFIQIPTQQRHKVVYAAAGAGGNAIDHLSKEAVTMYLNEVSSKLAGVTRPGQIRAMYSASFEVYGNSWTPGFLDEFRQRRGYDLKPHLPALFRDEDERTLHLRHDYWETVSELAVDNFMRPVGDWSRAHGFTFQCESYGEPPMTLGSFAPVDYPMGEDYSWLEYSRVHWAASAAHFYGRKEVSVEAYTHLRMARYSESLQDLKLASDLHFLSGANRIVAHGYQYSPPVAGVPGWGYYAGVMLTENQP